MKSKISDLTHADVDRILEIVDRVNDIDLQIRLDGFELRLRKGKVSVGGDAPAAIDKSAPHAVDEADPVAVSPQERDPVVRPDAEPVPDMGHASGVAPASSTAQGNELISIVAPMVGRFYRRPSPNEPAFVEVGSQVVPESSVCILEVMKLFNTISAGVTGEIVEIVKQEGEMVEEGDVLFKVRPQ